MANKMLIDASHPEETRVVVLRGNRVEEFDFESASRKQLRGNIYLAKVTRVEPSLQAAFVDYGGNRHGFLAFSEIHPDYYQIPVADRQALIEEEGRIQRAADAEAEHRAGRRRGRHRPARRQDEPVKSDQLTAEEEVAEIPGGDEPTDPSPIRSEAPAEATEAVVDAEAAPLDAEAASPESTDADDVSAAGQLHDAAEPEGETATDDAPPAPPDEPAAVEGSDASEAQTIVDDTEQPISGHADGQDEGGDEEENGNGNGEDADAEEDAVESVGGSDALEEVQERVARPRRQYKIQEVIKRRQVMLVQVVKEERGTKGAALTTYLSLAGRYSVLMPNTARGGGISRKITSAEDRRRLKDIAQDLEVPEGMGVILRTAGASRTKTEVKRDFEYLLRLWESVRDLTLKSTAPKLVYEEGSLVKRAIRDLYNKDIDDIIVGGDDAYRDAKDFMRMLMPSHAKNVKLYKDRQPLFTRNGIESQLDAMFSPVVQLKSGGYIVLNQAEALVAIDVNSGRATREHHIEDTALKTNIEAADEIARQLRLRDLAGLIVIDFIDMDEKRNNRTVERRLKDSLKHDRARIQVGRISHFGLLEMSRQRIRSSVLESSTERCPECGGTGHVRSVSSVALQLLRGLEEALIKSATHNQIVRTRADVALYVLNHKRAHLRALEERFKLTITVNADPTVTGPQAFVIDRGEQVHTPEVAKALVVQPDSIAPEVEREDFATAEQAEDIETAEDGTEQESEGTGEEKGPRRRRRRRRRRSGEPSEAEHGAVTASEADATGDETREEMDEAEGDALETAEPAVVDLATNGDGEKRGRRRGRRGRRGKRGGSDVEAAPEHGELPAPFEHAGDTSDPLADSATAQPEAFEIQPIPVDIESPQPRSTYDEPVGRPREPLATSPAEAATLVEPPPEPPRRRSTVREPAPVFGGESNAPAPSPAEPVALTGSTPAQESTAASSEASTIEADDNRPRRSGWWSRRFASRG